MKIKLKEKPEHVELIKSIGSNDFDTSREAMKIFAKLVGPLIKQVLDETDVIGGLYDTLTVGEFEPRTIPLDDYHNLDEPDHVRVGYASRPGDLAYSQVTGADDIAFATYWLRSAIAMTKRYLRAGRISHAENAIRKMINEVRYKNKVQAIQPIMQSVAQSETNDKYHVIRSQAANQLILKDFNRLQTLVSRIVTSGLGGTTSGMEGRGVTDLIMSPEMVEEIRGIAYEPMNTRGAPNSDESTALAAPDGVRSEVYSAAGIPTIYGTSITQMNEFGVGQQFNTIFDAYAGVLEYEGHGGGAAAQFDGANEEVILGINRAVDVNGLLKVEISDSESGSAFNARPDNQFNDREGKIGFYGEIEQGHMSVEARNMVALVV